MEKFPADTNTSPESAENEILKWKDLLEKNIELQDSQNFYVAVERIAVENDVPELQKLATVFRK